jgi:hypothetical protein
MKKLGWAGQQITSAFFLLPSAFFPDADHTISAHIEGCSFPKWIGTDQQRSFSVAGDKLKWTNSPPSVARELPS